jgi:predicted RNase H-like nuclease (RuvC/YqgF family)
MYLRSYKCGARDGHAGKRDRASKLTRREMEMQVIASKDAEIEDLKKRLKDATDIIKSRDDTISARDAQIAGLQSELDDLRKPLAEAKRKAAELEADLKKSKVCVRRMRGGGRLWLMLRVCRMDRDWIKRKQCIHAHTSGGPGEGREGPGGVQTGEGIGRVQMRE